MVGSSSSSTLVVPLDVVARICDLLGEEIRAAPFKAEGARRSLASMMTVSHGVHDLAGRALYRTLVVQEDNFEAVIRGLDLNPQDREGSWPNEASHERKTMLLGAVRHLVTATLPSVGTSMGLLQAFPASLGPLFRLVKTVALADTFLLSAGRHAITNTSNPREPYQILPHPFFEFLSTHAAPTSVCLAYPKWEQRDDWIESFDLESIRPWIDLSEFNTAPSSFEVSFWGKIQLRRYYLDTMRRKLDVPSVNDLLDGWNPGTLTLHNFDFAPCDCPLPPSFVCDRLRIFSCEEMCGHHPQGHYSHRPLIHSGECLANRGSYWYKARDLLRRLGHRQTKPKVVELGNVGTTFLLACRCQSKFNNAVASCKAALSSVRGIEVQTPHWSLVDPCPCCSDVSPKGQDTLDDLPDDSPDCVSLSPRFNPS
jgi:hypothetical protein